MEILIQKLYEPGILKIVAEGKRAVFSLQNSSGYGVMTRYEVFPGIDLIYNDMHLEDCDENKKPNQDIMEINHCRVGRFECEFRNGTYVYLSEGDLAINMLTNKPKHSCFPLAHYHGISVVIDLKQANKALSCLLPALGDITIDLYRIRDHLCAGDTCFIMRAEPSIEHIFSELYTAPERLKSGYFKLKILELLLFLSDTELKGFQEERLYFHKVQVSIIKDIKDYLVANLERHITLKELSEEFGIPLTSMKLCFKGVYGTPVYSYMLSYRIQTASAMLRNTNEKITTIGTRVGYTNCSKFSEAFKKITGLSPSEYRARYMLTNVVRQE
ncbi:MAG: AraC family transcriptional regulator [Bacillota bacterium]|jgi:AraC-like DNA-binding protein|nr:AraC family transcriptional regulator [Bacillota bacterium]